MGSAEKEVGHPFLRHRQTEIDMTEINGKLPDSEDIETNLGKANGAYGPHEDNPSAARKVSFTPSSTSVSSQQKVLKPASRLTKYFKSRKRKKKEEPPPQLTPTQEYVKRNIKMKLGVGTVPTTCYGNVEFKETTKRTIGRFIRCSHDTDPEHLFTLLTKHWKVPKPRLLISVTGGTMSLDLQPGVKKDFLDGLLKVASTPGAWVISGGTNTGVMKLVGDANHGTKNVCIGIAAWGSVAKRDTLQPTESEKAGKIFGMEERRSGETFPYQLGSYLVRQGEAFLDYNHTHFILVDKESEHGKWGCEIELRGKFEEYIIKKSDEHHNMTKIPCVLLVLEGGPGTLVTVVKAVENEIPCVLMEDSGRTADILVYAINSANQILEAEMNGLEHQGLIDEIKSVYNLEYDKHVEVMEYKSKLIKCIQRKNLFTISNLRNGMDTDDAILTALLKDTKTAPSHYEQMRLAMLWDRVDLAETKIMKSMHGQWIPRPLKDELDARLDEKKLKQQRQMAAEHELNELMIKALAMDKVDFVRLLLTCGVSVKSLLTRQVLQFLYAYRRDLGVSTMRYESGINIQEMRMPQPEYLDLYKRLQQHTSSRPGKTTKEGIKEMNLHTIRQKVYDLLPFPKKILEKVVEIPGEHWNCQEEQGELVDVIQLGNSCGPCVHSPGMKFKAPFCQLFIWAVLNNMLAMALLVWEYEDDAICKALIAAELINGLKRNIHYRNVQDEIEKSLEVSFETYRKLSLELLDLCYKTDEKNAELLITMHVDILSESSCLDFAVASEQKDFVSHGCVQGILSDVWTGSIAKRDISAREVYLYIFIPFLLSKLEMRTRKERKEMIQATHFDTLEDDESESTTRGDLRKGSIPSLSNCSEEEKMEMRKRLPWFKKFYYFHRHTPVVRFHMATLGYLLFLIIFACIATAKKTSYISNMEIVLMVTVFGYAVDEVYQLLHVDATSIGLKFIGYIGDFWNKLDIICLIVFIIAVILRCIPGTEAYGQLFYAFDVSLWIVRLINILYVDPVLGPYVVMIGHMFVDLMNFLIILIIFLLAYGIGAKGIFDPSDAEMPFNMNVPNAANVTNVPNVPNFAYIWKPYFHWYGEFFLEDPTYLGNKNVGNSYAKPIAFIYLAVYLLVVNLLLLNLVIAIFNSTYEKIMAASLRVWKFERYGLIVEYAQRRSVMFPPFSLLFHFYVLLRWLLSLCTGIKKKSCEFGLKPRENIGKAKKDQLRELESNCLIKLVRQMNRVEVSADSLQESSSCGSLQKIEFEKKFSEFEKRFSEQQRHIENMELQHQNTLNEIMALLKGRQENKTMI